MSQAKLGASFGIVAAVLLILTFVFGPNGAPPGFNDTARQVQAYIVDHHSKIQAVVALQFAALAAFTAFLGSVFFRLQAFETQARLSVSAVAGGVVLVAAAAVGTAAVGASAYHVETLDPGAVQALWDFSLFAFVFTGIGFAVLAGSAGALALHAGALPRWLGVYSVLAGLYALVVAVVGSFSETGAFSPSDGGLGLVVFLLVLIWILAMGIVLVRDPRPEGAATTQ